MTEKSVYLQPAFILQQRKYRETSLIMDVLTRDFGRISLLAKGVRKKKSRTAGLLQFFIPLAVSYVGKAELKILTDVEIIPPQILVNGTALYSGFYINELVSFFLHKDDPHPEVFNDYMQCLYSLSEQSGEEAALRGFELNLFDNAGYGLQFSYDYLNGRPIDPLKNYYFDIEQGPVLAKDGKFSGKTLLAMMARDFSDPCVRVEAKRLMRSVIDVYLQGKQLKSRLIMNQLVKHAKNA